MMSPEARRQLEELVETREKPWHKSKKFGIWVVSFAVLAGLLFYGLSVGADWRVLVALSLCVTVVSISGILGQAGVDAAVRFAKVWRGLAPGGVLDSHRVEFPDRGDV